MAPRSIIRPRSTADRAEVAALVGPAASATDKVGAKAASDARVDASLLGEHLRAVIAAALAGRRLSQAERDACRSQGTAAAERGVTLSALLDLYLSATWRLWGDIQQRTPRSNPEVVGTVAASLLRAADDAAEALAEGYELAQRRIVRFEESLRREFVDDLLSGTADPDVIHERAARFGFNLAGTHVVSVARGERRLVDAGPVHRRVEAHVLAGFGGLDVVVATKAGLLVCVFPHTARDPVDDLARALDGTGEGPWRMGVGRPDGGPSGVARSYREACQALDLAHRAGVPGPVARFQDLIAQRILAADPALGAELVDRVLGPLNRARGGAGPLVETLEAHFAAAGNITATARALYLSPRAVVYRLERIAALTGHSPLDPEGRFILELAVRSRRLSTPADPATPPRAAKPSAPVRGTGPSGT